MFVRPDSFVVYFLAQFLFLLFLFVFNWKRPILFRNFAVPQVGSNMGVVSLVAVLSFLTLRFLNGSGCISLRTNSPLTFTYWSLTNWCYVFETLYTVNMKSI